MTQEVASTAREERFQNDSGLNILFRSWRPAGKRAHRRHRPGIQLA